MFLIFFALATVAGFLTGRLSPIDWQILMDAAIRWREILNRSIEMVVFFVAGAGVVWISRFAAFVQYKNDVRLHMPEIIRVQMGDLEAKNRRLDADVDYWKARAEEQNAVVRNLDRQIDRLKSIVSAFETENEIQRQRKKA